MAIGPGRSGRCRRAVRPRGASSAAGFHPPRCGARRRSAARPWARGRRRCRRRSTSRRGSRAPPPPIAPGRPGSPGRARSRCGRRSCRPGPRPPTIRARRAASTSRPVGVLLLEAAARRLRARILCEGARNAPGRPDLRRPIYRSSEYRRRPPTSRFVRGPRGHHQPRMRALSTWIVASFAVLLCVPAGVLAAEPGGPTAPGSESVTRVIVRFAADQSTQERADLRARAEVERDATLPVRGLELVDPKPGVSVGAAVADLEGMDGVVYAEPDRVVRQTAMPNDPLLSYEWDMTAIRAPEAWDVTTGSAQVPVAVVDTGIDATHPDLAANLWTNPGESGGGRETNGLDDDGNGRIDDVHGWDFVDHDAQPQDGNGHGTHVAGTIAARGNDASGVAGLNWSSALMPLRVLGNDGSGYVSDAITAYTYAARNGARVVNASLGGAELLARRARRPRRGAQHALRRGRRQRRRRQRRHARVPVRLRPRQRRLRRRQRPRRRARVVLELRRRQRRPRRARRRHRQHVARRALRAARRHLDGDPARRRRGRAAARARRRAHRRRPARRAAEQRAPVARARRPRRHRWPPRRRRGPLRAARRRRARAGARRRRPSRRRADAAAARPSTAPRPASRCASTAGRCAPCASAACASRSAPRRPAARASTSASTRAARGACT